MERSEIWNQNLEFKEDVKIGCFFELQNINFKNNSLCVRQGSIWHFLVSTCSLELQLLLLLSSKCLGTNSCWRLLCWVPSPQVTEQRLQGPYSPQLHLVSVMSMFSMFSMSPTFSSARSWNCYLVHFRVR
jgi:hypothetical protein